MYLLRLSSAFLCVFSWVLILFDLVSIFKSESLFNSILHGKIWNQLE